MSVDSFWIISLGEDIKIAGPDEVVNQMKMEVERLMEQYKIYQ